METDLRCSSQARGLGRAASGTAVAADAFLVIEVPLPWPNDINDHAAVKGAADAIRAVGARVQAVVPPRSDAGQAQAVLYSHEGGAFTRYTRRDACLDAEDLSSGVGSLADAPVVDDDARDLLICTHGARDRCCGAMGTSLALGIASSNGLHVRRTSHLGGHRFAPTALLLPEGTAWAWLDEAILDAVLSRSGDIGTVLPHYRGSTAMATPALQLLERAVLGEVGWEFLDAARTGVTVDRVGARTTVHLETSVGAWTGVVEKLGTVPQPLCGAAISAAKKVDDVLQLVEFRQD